MKVAEENIEATKESWAHFMDKVVSVQIVFRHQSFSLYSSLAVKTEEDRVGTIEDKR